MVNLLEGLYAITVGAFVAMLVFAFRRRRKVALRFGGAAVFGVLLSALLYWYLAPRN